MKTLLLTLTLAYLIILGPAWADDTHHPKSQTQQAVEQTDKSVMENSIAQMKQMRKAIMAEQDPTTRHDLMIQHMEKMNDGMKMMSMMGHVEMMKANMPMMKEMMKGMQMQQMMMQKMKE